MGENKLADSFEEPMLFFLAEFRRIGGEKRRGRIDEESGKKEGAISPPRNGGKNERKKDDESEGEDERGGE